MASTAARSPTRRPTAGRCASDGGDFDQFTGATVTPRAVVRAVRKALTFAERHRDELFAAPPPATP